MKTDMDVEELEVHRMLCQFNIEMCELTNDWPSQERCELGTQVRRSSNSAPSQLAEKNDGRHIKNKNEGINRSRGEAAETIHHLFMAKLRHYMTDSTYDACRTRYKQCIRMLNGLERSLEKYLSEKDRRWNPSRSHSQAPNTEHP